MIPFALFLAPVVIAQRLPRLWWEAFGGNPFGPRETDVMLSEKMDAIQKGAAAAQRQFVLMGLESGAAMLRGQPVDAARIAMGLSGRVIEAALQPAARKVSANMKRLSRA
jgi:hypothetical protein